MPNYSRTNLNTDIASMVSGTYDSTNFNVQANRAVREVLSEVDLRSTKRKSSLSPNLFEDVFHYSAPTDLKGFKIIDIQQQKPDRAKSFYWNLTSEEEFDRYKMDGGENSLVAVSEKDQVRKLLLSHSFSDSSISIDRLDTVSDWEELGDAENLEKNTSNYIKGSGALEFDIDDSGGTTAGISNSSVNTFDITDYIDVGSVFVWVYIIDTDDITNFILKIGNSSSVYYSMTATTNNEGSAFNTGWNLLRFDMSGRAETGTMDDKECTYVALYMTKDAGKVSETGYLFNDLQIRLGNRFDLVYYSNYGWQTSAGVYLENSTNDTDKLNADSQEFNLISEKVAELVERNLLRNSSEANMHRAIYESLKQKYTMDNPSEALLMTTTYRDL
jgi:hypothetical protein